MTSTNRIKQIDCPYCVKFTGGTCFQHTGWTTVGTDNLTMYDKLMMIVNQPKYKNKKVIDLTNKNG